MAKLKAEVELFKRTTANGCFVICHYPAVKRQLCFRYAGHVLRAVNAVVRSWLLCGGGRPKEVVIL